MLKFPFFGGVKCEPEEHTEKHRRKLHVRCGVICASSHTRSSVGDPVKAETWTKVSNLLGVHGSTSTSCRGAKKSSSLLLFLFQLQAKEEKTSRRFGFRYNDQCDTYDIHVQHIMWCFRCAGKSCCLEA